MVRALLVLILVALGGSSACGSDSTASNDEITRALRNGDIAVTSIEGPGALMLRYVLQQEYGLVAGEDVMLVESSSDSALSQVLDGEVAAAAVAQTAAYDALGSDEIDLLVPLSKEVEALTGAPFARSMLVSYRDVAERKPEALTELDRLFEISRTYWNANRGQILDELAASTGQERDYLDWWWRNYDLPLGDLSGDTQRGILAVWEAAAALGDIERFADLSGMLFMTSSNAPTPVPTGVRETISLAVLDDPSRRAALYAIENGAVESTTIDVTITYLPQAALSEAASTGQYDIVEAQPLTVAVGPESGVDFVVISAGLRDLSGTVLVIASSD